MNTPTEMPAGARTYPIQIDETRFTIDVAKPNGAYLLNLVGRAPTTHLLTLIIEGADDQLIGPDEEVDLTQPGRERFTVVAKDPCITIIDIEGFEHKWGQPTITMEEIARLGGWNPSEGVILIQPDQTERHLQPGEVVELKCGMCFSKPVKFKRGCDERTH